MTSMAYISTRLVSVSRIRSRSINRKPNFTRICSASTVLKICLGVQTERNSHRHIIVPDEKISTPHIIYVMHIPAPVISCERYIIPPPPFTQIDAPSGAIIYIGHFESCGSYGSLYQTRKNMGV